MLSNERIMVGDAEVKVTLVDGEIDNSPKNPDNFCVSFHWLIIENGKIGPVKHVVWNHNEKDTPDDRQILQDDLNSVSKLICWNAKFDWSWLRDMEFDLPVVECAMIREFLFAQARPWSMSLKESAERRDVTRKKSDLVDEMFKSGTGFEAMPLDTVLEYAEADVISCAEIYLQQEEELNSPEYEDMKPIFQLAQDKMAYLVEIEDNGCAIDLDALEIVEKDFIAEAEVITKVLTQIVGEVMGDTPIKLGSGKDMSKVFYGREVIDRELHRKIFNIGLRPDGKPLPVPRMKQKEFNTAVRSTTILVDKTSVQCCPACDGKGKVQKYKIKWRTKNKVKYQVQGEPYKNLSNCDECKGVGAFYVSTGQRAGLKLVPEGAVDASIHGFKTDQHTIKKLLLQAKRKKNLKAEEFLTKYARLTAINSYLSSFVANTFKFFRLLFQIFFVLAIRFKI